MEACPSTFALDDREIHGGQSHDGDPVAAHAAACPRCQARIAERQRLRERFERQVSAPLWARIRAAPPARRWKLPALFASTAAAGLAAAVIAIVATPRGPDVRVKGQASVEILGR